MVDGISLIDLLSASLRSVHLLAVIVWIGGAIFVDRILQPSLRKVPPDLAGKLNQAIVKRFTPLVWGSIVVVAATGLLRANRWGHLSLDSLLGTSYGNALLLKMILFGVMIVVGLVISRIGLTLSEAQPREYVMQSMKRLKLLSEANILLGIFVIVLSVALQSLR